MCIFCEIIEKKRQADIISENDKVIAFPDIFPLYETHILIVPKIHIDSISSDGSEKIVEDLIVMAKEIAKDMKIEGYKLRFNVNKEGGQEVPHIHMHFLAGKPNKETCH